MTTTARLHARLSAMMFLEFAAKGVWFVVVAGHMEALGFSGRQISYVYATGALGAVISPLFAGWLADRFMAAEKFAALCHLLASGALLLAWRQTGFLPFWCAIFLHALLTAPTVALMNAISFHHMKDPVRFGHVRVWGTVGWALTNWCMGLYLLAWARVDPAHPHLQDCLPAGALLSVVMALYCLTLPHTPPSRGAERSPYAFLRSLRLTAESSFAVLLAISVVAGLVLPFFYNFTFLFLTDSGRGLGLQPGAATLAITLAQVAEFFFMLALARVLPRAGMRITLALGLAGLVARGCIFAAGSPAWLVISALALHGLDYAFFFIAAVIAAERFSPRAQRASVQSLMVFSTYGVGMLMGHAASGWAYDLLQSPQGETLWSRFFLVPAVLGAAGLAALLVRFRGEGSPAASA